MYKLAINCKTGQRFIAYSASYALGIPVTHITVNTAAVKLNPAPNIPLPYDFTDECWTLEDILLPDVSDILSSPLKDLFLLSDTTNPNDINSYVWNVGIQVVQSGTFQGMGRIYNSCADCLPPVYRLRPCGETTNVNDVLMFMPSIQAGLHFTHQTFLLSDLTCYFVVQTSTNYTYNTLRFDLNVINVYGNCSDCEEFDTNLLPGVSTSNESEFFTGHVDTCITKDEAFNFTLPNDGIFLIKLKNKVTNKPSFNEDYELYKTYIVFSYCDIESCYAKIVRYLMCLSKKDSKLCSPCVESEVRDYFTRLNTLFFTFIGELKQFDSNRTYYLIEIEEQNKLFNIQETMNKLNELVADCGSDCFSFQENINDDCKDCK